LPSRSGPGWTLTALWPSDRAGDCDENDRSVVVAVEFAGRRLVLAGDIEAKGEAGLVRSFGPRLDADLVAAPHHGSRTSSSPPFVRATSPAWVVASTGRDNRYGFPRPETVARYRAAGATVLATAEVGAIHARIDDDGRLTVRTGPTSARTDAR
jgi:competence protein ComEC